jgi:hypothetical protein
MSEETKPKCPFVFEDGRPCVDVVGHEEYALNCGHLPPPPPPFDAPRPVRHPLGRRSPLVVAVAAMAMLTAGIDTPRRRELPPPPPLPPDFNGPPPLPTKTKGSSGYGRPGTQPIPRAFYSSRLLPGEDELQSLLDQGEKRASDQRHLTAAEEKRARKARKRLGR